MKTILLDPSSPSFHFDKTYPDLNLIRQNIIYYEDYLLIAIQENKFELDDYNEYIKKLNSLKEAETKELENWNLMVKNKGKIRKKKEKK